MVFYVKCNFRVYISNFTVATLIICVTLTMTFPAQATLPKPASKNVTFLATKRIGDACPKNGEYTFTGGALGICKKGKIRYAFPTDVPPTPKNGYASRPAWFPSLAQQYGHRSEPTCKPHSISFSHSIVPLDQLAPITPSGAMIGDHVTPIDHGYLGIKSLYKLPADRRESDYVPVVAPADGIITSLASLGSPSSNRVVIEHGCNLVSIYMVLNKPSGVLAKYVSELKRKGFVSLKVPIKAGQEFGLQRDNPLDFNIFDGTTWLSGFANPYSYLSEGWKPFTADPLPFFTPAIRAVYEKFLQRTVPPRFGKIDYDIIGSAKGNWFLDGTVGYSGQLISSYAKATKEIPGGSVSGKNSYSWSHLSISPDAVDTSKWIFSCGWWNNPAGDAKQAMIIIGPEQVTPDKLTSEAGITVYQIARWGIQEPPGSPARIAGSMAPYSVGYTLSLGEILGVVGLRVNTNGTLSVEIDTTMTSPSQFTTFTKNRRTYHR